MDELNNSKFVAVLLKLQYDSGFSAKFTQLMTEKSSQLAVLPETTNMSVDGFGFVCMEFHLGESVVYVRVRPEPPMLVAVKDGAEADEQYFAGFDEFTVFINDLAVTRSL